MSKIKRFSFSKLVAALALFCFLAIVADAQTKAFTYQGRLTDNNAAANGNYDFRFQLYNTALNFPTGDPVFAGNVLVTNGAFTVKLDFSSSVQFQQTTNNKLSLEVAVRPAGSSGDYTPLAPRQDVNAAPFAVASVSAETAKDAINAQYAGNATLAQDSNKLGGIAAANYLQTNGSGASLTNLNASNITRGSLPEAQHSPNVAFRNQANTFAGDQTINGDLSQTGTTASLTLTNGFLARGTLNMGAIPATGAGARIMFYSRKAAFRAGSVSGTQWNDANIGNYSTALGYNTIANGTSSTALGTLTIASGNESTALGYFTDASGNHSTALGTSTSASGDYSTALGYRASTNGMAGSFTYSDFSDELGPNVRATAPNQFVVRAQNIWLGQNNLVTNTANRFIETSTGAYLSTGGTWTNSSSVKLKTNFAPVNSRSILQKVVSLPIQTWNYKTEDASVQHIGAMAQDFHNAFQLSADDEHISTVDADGVALAAIQGLDAELKDALDTRDAEIESLRKQIRRQQTALDNLKKFVCRAEPHTEFCQEEKQQ